VSEPHDSQWGTIGGAGRIHWLVLLIPAFLIAVGMLINPAVLFSLNTIVIAAAFLAALALGKFLAA
jgi:hypothetical protein